MRAFASARSVHVPGGMRRLLLATTAFALACSAAPNPYDTDGPEPVDQESAELTATDPVSLAVSTSCTTLSVHGLSQQLVDEIQCLKPNTLESIANVSKVSLGSAVFPYLQQPAADTLSKVVAARGTTLTIDSALRTLPQQYLLYQWYLQGRCGIPLAAAPGQSNHESGLAMDVEDSAGWRPYLQNHGWQWLGSSDPAHYTYVAGGTDIRSLSVLAFQKLWNLNHPSDLLVEDGAYGTETEKRLVKSPVGGFAKGSTCDAQPSDAGAPPPPKDAGSDAAAQSDAGSSEPPPPAAGNDAGAPIASPGSQGCSSTGGPPDAAWLVAAALLLSRRRVARRA